MMKFTSTIILLISLLVNTVSWSQNLSKSFTYDAQLRNYRIYIPSSYDGSQPVPLVLALHGMGDTGSNFQGIGLNQFANTDTFIAVYPNALVDQTFGASGWNAGVGAFGIFVSGDVDDIGFLNALIDTVSNNYSIDSLRVYATGFSIGGFMAQRLACELNDRIAAIASVSGLIGNPVVCNNVRPTPVLHMHGTSDSTITYNGEFNTPFGRFKVGQSVDEMFSTWETNNECSGTPVETPLPDIANDGYTIDHFYHGDCRAESEIELYRINGAPHIWLGPNNDVYATEEIWNFFKRHYKREEPDTVPTAIVEIDTDLKIYPNPFSNNLQIIIHGASLFEVSIFNATGKKVFGTEYFQTTSSNIEIPTVKLTNGVYILQLRTAEKILTRKVIKQD